jgi:phenylalanyl-tRNA synthetase beta chain
MAEKEEDGLMPVVTFNKKYLLKLMSMSLSDGELTTQLHKLGFSTERIDKEEISLEITPNRPDLYSAVGLARSLKNFMHRSKKLIYQIKEENPVLEINVGKEISKIRPFIASMAVYDLNLDEIALTDIINFTEKLCDTYGRSRKKIAIGLHDLDQIETPLYYNAYLDEKFIPLNDKKERSFSEVLKSTEKGNKYGAIIKDASKRYPALKDNNGVIALIPILNSDRTKVTTKTKNILVDITGIYEDSVNKTADMIAAIFMDLGAGVKKVEINYSGKTVMTPLLPIRYITLPFAMTESEIGVSIGFNNVISLANKMGYEAALTGKDVRFRVPTYRMDIINEQDVVEDIAIAYGYDYIQPVPIPSTQKGELEQSTIFFEELSNAMVGIGFSESMNTYLTNEEANFDKMRVKKSVVTSPNGTESIKLKNAKAQSITMMRTWLLPSLLHDLGISRHEKMPQKIFELDMAFKLEKKVPKEDYHLAGVSVDPKSNFNYIKGVIERIGYSFNMEFKVEKYSHPSFIDGRCAKIMLGKDIFCFFGELHPEVLSNFGIEEPASAFEIDLSKM